tara:strand:+ start:2823 stop:3065 length:243 start_codon:yes stop_codon:yes gene_type:complete
MKTNYKMYYNDNGTDIPYSFKDTSKIHWKTWKPKVEDIQLLIDLTDKTKASKLCKEIWEDIMYAEHPPKKKLTGIYKNRR